MNWHLTVILGLLFTREPESVSTGKAFGKDRFYSSLWLSPKKSCETSYKSCEKRPQNTDTYAYTSVCSGCLQTTNCRASAVSPILKEDFEYVKLSKQKPRGC